MDQESCLLGSPKRKVSLSAWGRKANGKGKEEGLCGGSLRGDGDGNKRVGRDWGGEGKGRKETELAPMREG